MNWARQCEGFLTFVHNFCRFMQKTNADADKTTPKGDDTKN